MNDKRRTRRMFSASAYLGVVLVVVAAFVLASSAIALADDSGLPPTTTVSPALTGTIANGVSASLTTTDFAPSSGVKYVFYNADGSGLTTVTGTSVPAIIFNTVGNHSLVYYSQDTSGNTEAAHTANFVISDTQPPWSTLGIGFSSVYSDTATISITATDTFTGLGNAYAYIGSGVKNTFYKLSPASTFTTYTTALVVPKAGDYTLQYYSKDTSGNVESTQTAFFTVADATPPVTTSNAVALYNMTAAITLTPSDGANGSGIAGTFYSVDGASTYTSGTAVSVTTLGAHTLSFYSVDLAGNQESPAKTVSFTISDLLAPNVFSDALSTYGGPAAITITANDTGTGVAHIYYKLDGGSTHTVTATSGGVRAASIPQIASFSVPPTTGANVATHAGVAGQTPNGTNTNCACHTVSTTIASISSSAVVPSGHFEAVPATACNNCHVVFAAAPAPQATFSTVVNVAASGDHTLEFWADDAASPVNTSGHLTASFHVDNTVATPPVTTSDAVASYTGSATIHLSATGGTGALSTFYKLDAAAYASGTVVSTSVLGSHTLSFYSADSINNTETAHTVTFTVVSGGGGGDTTAPNTISDAQSSYDDGGPAVIHLTATDSQSGIKATYYTVDGGAVTTVTPPASTRHAASIPAIASFTIPSTTGAGAGSHASVLGQPGSSGNCACHTVSTTIAAITSSAVVPSGHFEAVPVTPCNNCHVVTSSGGGGTPAGPASFTTTVTVSGVGSHSLVFWSVDVSGNVEAHKTAAFTIVSGETTQQVASLSKVPQRRSITVVRHHGVGHFQFAAILRGPGDVGIPGKTILLQKSADGVNFTTVRGASMVADAGGRVVVQLEFKGAGTSIWRWLFAGDADWAATSTSKTYITVK